MYIGPHIEYPSFLSDFNPIWILDRFFKSDQISWKSIQWEPGCTMRTDRHDEANNRLNAIFRRRLIRMACYWVTALTADFRLFDFCTSIDLRAFIWPLVFVANCSWVSLLNSLQHRQTEIFHECLITWSGPGSVDGIATGYGLDGPVIESRWGARFSAPFHTGPGAHPASCTMGTGSFPEEKSDRGVTLAPHPFLVSWSRKGRAIPLLPLWAVRPVQSLRACTRVHFTFFFPSYKTAKWNICHVPTIHLTLYWRFSYNGHLMA